MLKSVRFVNWKSFRDATLHIDPLTVLIGGNSSGKSNAIEGLQLLSRLAQGVPTETALAGSDKMPGLRGGTDWAGFRGAPKIQFELRGSDLNAAKDLMLEVTVNLKQEIRSRWNLFNQNRESITIKEAIGSGKLEELAVDIFKNNYNEIIKQSELDVNNLQGLIGRPLFNSVCSTYFPQIQTFFILCPDPTQMRRSAGRAEQLMPDARNIAGVIAGLPDAEQQQVLDTLSSFLSRLPEFQVKRVFIEKYGLHKNDAMLCCEESWGYPIDARCMSDGTLRFVAILVAILTLPKGSLLVIEDVDTGIHPSRAGLVLEVLRSEGKRRSVDVLVTTHNVAFLDALPPELSPFVTVAYRDAQTGESQLKPLDELGEYGRIVAAGSIGRAVVRGVVARAVQHESSPKPSEPSSVDSQ